MNHENYISPLHTKRCELLRQPCHEPFVCGNGCQCAKKEASDMPVVMFDKPYQWLHDLCFAVVYAVGVVALCAMVGLLIGYFYARFV